MSEFKAGDRVSWLGLKGTVREVLPGTVDSVVVVDCDDGIELEFFSDGRYLESQRPSLKKLKKKKARYYYAEFQKMNLYLNNDSMRKELHGHWLKDCGMKKPKGAS